MTGEGSISRRDFLKLAFGLAGAVVARPVFHSIENGADDILRTEVLKDAREYLIENEAIPPNVKDVPVKTKVLNLLMIYYKTHWTYTRQERVQRVCQIHIFVNHQPTLTLRVGILLSKVVHLCFLTNGQV